MPIVMAAAGQVRAHLDYPTCIGLMRQAMIRLSLGETRQLPRQILRLDNGMLGVMPGAIGPADAFGLKVVSVYPGNFAKGLPSHQGMIMLFEPEHGVPIALVDAGEVTRIRTASASAAATDALARQDARVLAVLGYGEQAEAHIAAIRQVRPIERVLVWGRNAAKCTRFAGHVGMTGIACEVAATPAEAAASADIICTVTGASEPVLSGADVRPGTHVNLVGSSHAGPAEADNALVAGSRYFVDSREAVLAQGAEYLRARDAGLIDETHILGEIGEVFGGSVPGRTNPADVTIYKSLGQIIQDLASAWHVYSCLSAAAETSLAGTVTAQ
ncbi:ornithine cyclodeaminase family protein [Novosphingobium album (ex Hu et al. 2023)]|uniref:Ornithine cyclodeaminase family protein n=1 Tax=Novosphingobium album (ex Hu et al. 2023) TaxID=2930093 RepID=A0ABT0B7I6_9SPHN|nr:ornithine cyclodeaminase family protein [Novosphingobium album (ex Hu et al. 2023)]MCJ2180953.1 ornithine cyclodeaminase family protein [Novosphingobium album (ex Hu et al. 2023)]